jgi:hypothetical protein
MILLGRPDKGRHFVIATTETPLPMQLIKYKKQEGLLTIETSISVTPTWYYYYNEDQLHENDNSLNKPKEHTIGKPHELVKVTHNWKFVLANPSINQIVVDVMIDWYQIIGGVKTKIHHWQDTSIKVPAGGAEESGESAMLIGI